VPPLADLALRAGDFLAVLADSEVVAGVALQGAVLAGGVAGQWPGAGGDLVLAPGPLHRDQGGVAAVGEVPGGEQAPALQPGVDASHAAVPALVAGMVVVATPAMTLGPSAEQVSVTWAR
jgi:hypothetical protein